MASAFLGICVSGALHSQYPSRAGLKIGRQKPPRALRVAFPEGETWMPNHLSTKSRLLMAACSLIMVPGAALAQSATPQPAQEEATTVGEIVVTANKRKESLQDVPASVAVISEETLENAQIANPQDFPQLAPTLNFQAADEARLFNFSIRGIGTESFSVGVEPSVATIIDGVVYTRPGAAFDGLADIEQVEVLNGPQGTLQGKNASAGAVNIVTRRPNREHFEGRASLTLAEANEHRGELSLTGPINDTLAPAVHLLPRERRPGDRHQDRRHGQQCRELWGARQAGVGAARGDQLPAGRRRLQADRRLLRRAAARRRRLRQCHRRLHRHPGRAGQ
ncbi:TonB-dependent receptor [Brevundimonas goettingensis]|uniref:TonB-dependent receptor n=1 Tax=Brevundimonas goettingensis TaxID=2774190 RepID=UPI001CEDC1B2|nr:TonB-dependent receptor plug domain-containing protein [Brevundimonas goettingensis]